MRIAEILDGSDAWSLKSPTPRTQYVTELINNQGSMSSVMVWENEADPDQLIFMGWSRGAWEVHHLMIHLNRLSHKYEIVTGEKISLSSDDSLRNKTSAKPNTGFLNTAINLYRKRLARNQPIRILTTADSGLWPSYDKFIDYLVRRSDGKLIASEIERGVDAVSGEETVSRTIANKNTGKFPALSEHVRNCEVSQSIFRVTDRRNP